ncbi:type ISP restriction/modification enzyme [Microvirga sp. M2]|uniref:type ISP restriction/modification enzyme n=1 Tax=Microvirga sp. M2 TaxID=3073270 RepID=UPI0039C348BD
MHTALNTVREGLEQALGLHFEGAKGEHFFRSTLVQTLFYGVFAAWVQWSREQPPGSTARFDWRMAGWSLHVPMVRNLFEQVATPTHLGPLGLVEVLDWTGTALNRVDRAAFFSAFDVAQAVQYFYEPFLAQFDPELRKQLGVWYTPPEIVRYMVERVDAVLQTEFGLTDGLADPNVHVLDPCCGTGSFLIETLRLIEGRLHAQGSGALLGQDLKHAAMNRVFGFEIMPAPFVVAHWQIGLLLAEAGASLSAGHERAAVYLTNALTGWEPPQGPRAQLILPQLQPERDAAEQVKQATPILVVIGNPPYNAFAGTSPDEEDDLVVPYKEGLRRDWGIKKFNLDELYVRFLRVAERRIVEQTGRGIVCYISSYSYLSDPSFVVARRRLLDGFDAIWIDSLNGDSRETGKLTPSGEPDPSVFSTEFNREGIKLGTAVGLFVRRDPHDAGQPVVRYRDFWGRQKREELEASLALTPFNDQYAVSVPTSANRFNFRPQAVSTDYDAWPSLRELAEVEPFSGLSEKRKGALIDFERTSLEGSIQRYLDPNLSFETVKASGDGPVEDAARFDARSARTKIIAREPYSVSRVVRYAMYPMDLRWAYHTNIRPIWNEPRPEFSGQVRDRNLFVVSRMAGRRPDEGLPVIATRALANHHLLDPNAHAIPTRLFTTTNASNDLFGGSVPVCRANLSAAARTWLSDLGWPDPDSDQETGSAPWLHALAICCAPEWLSENRAAILAGWPRVPLPSDADTLRQSVAFGTRIAALLDPDETVTGVTAGNLAAPFTVVGTITHAGGGQLGASDLAITAGWGRGGNGRPVMPAQGRIVERDAYGQGELAAITSAAQAKGEHVDSFISRLGPPVDVYLNEVAYWSTVPRSVWDFSIGGYQVFKKWLSYREEAVLGRPLTTTEVREATSLVRRLTALIMMGPELNANYQQVKAALYDWSVALAQSSEQAEQEAAE